MPKSNWVSSSELRQIVRLVGECRELGDDPIVWRQHLSAGLGRLIDADLVLSAEVANCLHGTMRLPIGTAWGLEHGFSLEAYRALGEMFPDHHSKSRVFIAQVNEVRAKPEIGSTFARQRVSTDRQWERSFDYQCIARTVGTDASLHSLHPTALENHFDGLTFARAPGRPKFNEHEEMVARIAHEEVARLVGAPLAQWDEPAPSQLPARARQVLQCLLEGDTDKQIAARLGLSPHTVNQYTKQIYGHFNVNGRVELLARWVRRGWSSKCQCAVDDFAPHWDGL